MNANDLENRINRAYADFSKAQRLLATYISENYEKAAFYTVHELATSVGVSESTVMRFSNQLGYKKFPDFQKALAVLLKSKLMEYKEDKRIYEEQTSSDTLFQILKSDEMYMKETRQHIDKKSFEVAINILLGAKRVYIIGLRNSEPLAQYFAYYLKFLKKDIRILSTIGSEELLEQIYHITNEDVVFGISFPQYSIRTLKVLEFANQRNAKVITLTDSVHSPISLYSSCNLVARTDISYIVESLTAPMSVLHAILVRLCNEKKEELSNTMSQLEKIWDDYGVIGNDNMEYIEDRVKVHYSNARKVTGDIDE